MLRRLIGEWVRVSRFTKEAWRDYRARPILERLMLIVELRDFLEVGEDEDGDDGIRR